MRGTLVSVHIDTKGIRTTSWKPNSVNVCLLTLLILVLILVTYHNGNTRKWVYLTWNSYNMDLVNLPLSRWGMFVGSRLRKPGQVITRSWTQTARKYHALQRVRKPQHYSFSLGNTLQAQIEIHYELNQLDFLISFAARAQNASLSAIMVLHSDSSQIRYSDILKIILLT